MISRLARLRQALQTRGLDALLVSSLYNIRYLTGFTGSHGLCVVTRRAAALITDTRYRRQSALEVKQAKRIISRLDVIETLAAEDLLSRCRRVGFEADQLPYAHYRKLKHLFPRISFSGLTGIVEDLELVKDAGEVEKIQKAARISDRVFHEVLSSVRPGVRELDVAAEISYLQKRHGGERDSFDPIVASGERGVLPHAQPTAKRIRPGDMVIMDFGCTWQGYCSDLTRTVAVGKITRKARQMYEVVQEAHAAAIDAAKAGMWAKELDAVARTRIKSAGYGRYFVHSLGHGLGLQVHERPRVSFLSKERLLAGNVVTIEPGIYVPGVGGVRIEDDIVLTKTGCRVLTDAPRELTIV